MLCKSKLSVDIMPSPATKLKTHNITRLYKEIELQLGQKQQETEMAYAEYQCGQWRF